MLFEGMIEVAGVAIPGAELNLFDAQVRSTKENSGEVESTSDEDLAHGYADPALE